MGCFEVNTGFNGRSMQIKLWIGNNMDRDSTIQNFKFVLIENGKMTNHQSGQTKNVFLTLNNNDPNEFIYFPVSGTFYQFYYVPLEDKIIGDNYSGQPDGTYKLSGTTNMVRGEVSCSWINDYVW